MFETVELGSRVSAARYEAEVMALRPKLLDAQFETLRRARFPVVVLVNGVDGAGKSEAVSALTEWMDPRHVRAHALGEPTDEERQRPPFYRFFRELPARGRVGVFFGNWYTQPIVDRALGRAKRAPHQLALEEIRRFERMLVDEGGVLLKLWFHLSKKAQRKRLEELEARTSTAWRVTKEEWRHFRHYDAFRTVSEDVLRATDTPWARWTLVDGSCVRHASLTAGRAVLAAIEEGLARDTEQTAAAEAAAARSKAAGASGAARTKAQVVAPARGGLEGDAVPIVRTLDLTRTLAKDTYEKRLLAAQRALALATRDKRFRAGSLVVVFEGMDAAGKGGAIRRVTQALDPRIVEVVPIAAPSDEEKARPYLYRFYRHAPRDGRVVIFDRSWYGRVLVERIEGFCSEADWQRAYDEINDFEAQLVRSGDRVVKFWLQISPEEQLRRFREREETAHKRFKITPEDWRNRARFEDYEVAASEMVLRTSTDVAPWTLVEAEDKRHARVKVLETLVAALRDEG